mmetsp:Transcript_22749/g.31830  ORF Transcript_22749/g.31830 Transcript_22749/m.31830 type:complete len:182 (+) Transcript_22749:463-1008(+)
MTDSMKKESEEHSGESAVGGEVEIDKRQVGTMKTELKTKATIDPSSKKYGKERLAVGVSKLASSCLETKVQVHECVADRNTKFACTPQSLNGIDLDVILHGLANNESFIAEIPKIAAKIKNRPSNKEMQKVLTDVIERNPELLQINGLKELLPHSEKLQDFLSYQWGQLNLLVKALTKGTR